MKKLICISLFSCIAAGHAAMKPMALPRSTPEKQGISSAALQAFIETADQQVNTMNSFMLVRHGHVVAEGWWTPYSAESPHSLYSLSKSFTSTAVGLAAAEGKLSLDDEVLKFFPDEAPAEPGNNLKAMRVRDLLRMAAGHQSEVQLASATNQTWTKAFLAHPVPHKPGTHFVYNTPATYMQSAIVQKATGMTVLDFLRPRLFEPLGIENPSWATSPQGISLGGYGLSIRTEDIAKFGQLFLRKGEWNGQRLVPAEWVQAATSLQTANGSNPKSDWDQGYGFQFWRCRHDCYRGDGAFGQFCIVMPRQDAVVAITSGTKDMQGVMNLVWDKLLPAMKPSPLPSNDRARKKLQQTLAGLKGPLPQGAASSPLASKIAGTEFLFPENGQKLEALSLESEPKNGALTMVVRMNGRSQRVVCGSGAWEKGRLAYANQPEQPVAAAGAWAAEDTYTGKLCFYESPTSVTLNLRFAGDQVFYDAESNVGFGSTKQPQLVGRAK